MGGVDLVGHDNKKSCFLIGHAPSVSVQFKASTMTRLKCKHASTHVHTPARQYGVVKNAVLCTELKKKDYTVHDMEPSVSQRDHAGGRS